MQLNVTEYMKEIENSSWIQEMIMERFDNALELMTPNSVIYGGAIRDCIANKELLGDLDLSVSIEDFNKISESFNINPKWIPFDHTANGDINNYSKILSPVSSVHSFKTLGNKIIQLVISKCQDKDTLQNSIYVARMVDIVCCGVIMLYDGRIFEVIPGAYQDCIDGILRINKNSDNIYAEVIKMRVNKLVHRGWKNFINIDKVIKDIEHKKEKERKKNQRLINEKNKNCSNSNPTGVEEYNFFGNEIGLRATLGGRFQEIPKKDIDNYFNGSYAEGIRFLENVSQTDGIYIRVKYTPIKNLYYETINSDHANKVKKRLNTYYLKRFKNKPMSQLINAPSPNKATITYTSSSNESNCITYSTYMNNSCSISI